jgi:hypothetical protein
VWGRGEGKERVYSTKHTEAEFLDLIQTKVLRVFLLAFHSTHGTSYVFLQTHATFYIFVQFSYCTYTVKEKGKKPDRKPCLLPHALRNPYRNLKPENYQDYAQKPKQNCTFMNLASAHTREKAWVF